MCLSLFCILVPFTVQTRQCRSLHSRQRAHVEKTYCRRQVPEFVDIAPLSELVELRQSASHRDPITARKLNALGSKRASANYRVRMLEDCLARQPRGL